MKKLIFSASIALSLAAPQAINAISISGSVGGAPTGVNYLNFDSLALGSGAYLVPTVAGSAVNESIALQVTSNAGVVQGSVGGQYAAPFISGANDVNFAMVGQPNPGADTTHYLTSGKLPSGVIEFTFNSPQQYFGLLWGSVDGFNTLTFLDAANNVVDTVTGGDVLTSPNGDQGVNGTLYVNINTTSPYSKVRLTSTEFAFEIDNVSYNVAPVSTPDGGAILGSFGAVLVGMAGLSRRRFAK